jgi:hypothetical protein
MIIITYYTPRREGDIEFLDAMKSLLVTFLYPLPNAEQNHVVKILHFTNPSKI